MARDRMTIVEHLEELRRRLIWTALTLVVTIGVSFAYAPKIFTLLLAPVAAPIEKSGGTIAYMSIAEGFLIQFRLAAYVGLVLASPVIGYHILAFILPGLTPRERRFIWSYLPAAVVLFAIGAVLAYLVFLPYAITFLIGFTAGGQARTLVSVSNLVSFVTGLVIPFGLVFELPLVVALLTRLGLISPRFLTRMRKYALLVVFVAAAILTPSPDVVTQTIVAVPLYGLFEASILVSKLVRRSMDREEKRRQAEDALAEEEEPSL